MASALIRLSARRGSAIRRVFSSAATGTAAAVPSGGEGLAVRRTVSLPLDPPRRLLSSGVRGDQAPMSPHEEVELLQQKVKEIDQHLEEKIIDILKQYKIALQAADNVYFERFLSLCGVPKNKCPDGFVRACELTALLVLSGTVGFVLARVKKLNDVEWQNM